MKQKDPYEIDEVPLEASVLNHTGALGAECKEQENRKDNQTDQHVNGVKSREQKIRASPHGAAWNDGRQFEPGKCVVETARVAAVFTVAPLARSR